MAKKGLLVSSDEQIRREMIKTHLQCERMNIVALLIDCFSDVKKFQYHPNCPQLFHAMLRLGPNSESVERDT